MSNEEMLIRKQIAEEILAYQKDWYKKRINVAATYSRKEIAYIANGMKLAAKLVEAGNVSVF